MEEQNIYQQIQELIEASELKDIQKREFAEVFARTKEAPLRPVLKLFKEDPDWVEILYKNYSEKKHAFVTGSISEWRGVVEKEKRELAI